MLIWNSPPHHLKTVFVINRAGFNCYRSHSMQSYVYYSCDTRYRCFHRRPHSYLMIKQTTWIRQNADCRVILGINSKHSLFSLHQDQFLEDWMNRFSPNKKHKFLLQIMRLSHFKHTLRNFTLFIHNRPDLLVGNFFKYLIDKV